MYVQSKLNDSGISVIVGGSNFLVVKAKQIFFQSLQGRIIHDFLATLQEHGTLMILQDAEDHEERDKNAFHSESEAPINVALVLRLYIERSKRIHCTPSETINRTMENRPLFGYVIEDLSF